MLFGTTAIMTTNEGSWACSLTGDTFKWFKNVFVLCWFYNILQDALKSC